MPQDAWSDKRERQYLYTESVRVFGKRQEGTRLPSRSAGARGNPALSRSG